MFPDPFCQPNHCQAFAGTLGVPDDAIFPAMDVFLGGFDAKVLVMATNLFDAIVKDDEVVEEF